MTAAAFEREETERMRLNAFKVCKEIASRIDGAPAPDVYLKGLLGYEVLENAHWFQFNQKYLEDFTSSHYRKGDKFAEFIKCTEGSSDCRFSAWKSWSGPVTTQIPQPMPDKSKDSTNITPCS